MIKFNPQKDLLRVLHFIDKFSADSKRVERLRPFFNFRSQIYFKYDGVLNRPDLSKVLGRKWKSSLPKLIMLGRYCKNHLCNFEMDYRTYDYTDYPPIEINQNDPHLQSQVGSVNLTRHEKEPHQNLSRFISSAIKIGLLYCPPFGNHFSFNNLLKSDNFAKIYFFNPDLLDYLEETASENKVKVKPYKKRRVKKSSSKSARQVHLPSSPSPSIPSSIISS